MDKWNIEIKKEGRDITVTIMRDDKFYRIIHRTISNTDYVARALSGLVYEIVGDSHA